MDERKHGWHTAAVSVLVAAFIYLNAPCAYFTYTARHNYSGMVWKNMRNRYPTLNRVMIAWRASIPQPLRGKLFDAWLDMSYAVSP